MIDQRWNWIMFCSRTVDSRLENTHEHDTPTYTIYTTPYINTLMPVGGAINGNNNSFRLPLQNIVNNSNEAKNLTSKEKLQEKKIHRFYPLHLNKA